jgi:hypothetical protein
MIMKKISDRLYEFFELGVDDYNLESTEPVADTQEVEDYSWLLESINSSDLDDLDAWADDFEDEEVDVLVKPKSKKDELIESLNYLKSKPNKTKQDRESIYTLEVVLKNMS